jgi:hypothetical protein
VPRGRHRGRAGRDREGAEGTARRGGIDGRIVILGSLLAYGVAVALARAAWDLNLWPHLGVDSAPTLFYDARNVAAAADCWSMGYDPLVENPCDPAARVMIYPRVWVLLHFVGVTQSRTLLFGAIVVGLFIGSLLLLVGRVSLAEGVVLAVAVTSPAVMFAVERANMDLVLFVLFVLAVVAWGARERVTPALSPALILTAAIAKLYAIVALPAYAFTGDRRARWVVPAGIGVMIVYLLLTLQDFRTVMGAPEGGLLYSYGARILIGDLYHRFSPGDWRYGNLLAQAIAVVPVLLVSTGTWIWARRRLASPAASERSSTRLLAFHLGAFTYLGTFVARRSGDYRLVFLLLTLPLLLEWAAGAGSSLRTGVARAGLVAVIAALWVGALSPFIGPWDELASWAAAIALVLLLAATLPRLQRARAHEPLALMTGEGTEGR